jgi:hypothetical protein
MKENIKCLVLKLTMVMKNSIRITKKTVKKEIEEDARKWKYQLCS